VARGPQSDNSIGPPVHQTYPDLPLTQASAGPSYTAFSLASSSYQLTADGSINYVKGWIQYLISLGTKAPPGTGGSGVFDFGNHPGSFSGTDWRYCMQSTLSPTGYTYWDGSVWQNVPADWSDPDGTHLYPVGVWVENLVNKFQFGTWPAVVPPWGPAEESLASTVLPKWVNTIQTVWSNVFDIKRDQCPSSDPQCCRYHVKITASFTMVTAKSGSAIVLAGNNARSNAGAWSMGESRVNMPAHEFGHKLGNPDEYQGGVGVDPSVNTDGATAGIDADSIMGRNMTVVKKRHFVTILDQLSSMVDTAAGASTRYSYKLVAGTSGGPNASH
jgi:hypothetical protein